MAKHHFSETQHDAMNISDVCPIMPHVSHLKSRYLSYWNPHQIIGQLHGLLIADHRQFSIWSTTDGVVPKRSHREPNSLANFQSEKTSLIVYDLPVGPTKSENMRFQVASQFLSSKQYFVGFMTSWYWISALSRWRLYMCAYLTESCVVFLQKQQALCPAVSTPFIQLPSHPLSGWEYS